MAYWYDDSTQIKTSRRLVDFIMDNDDDVELLPKIGIPGVPQAGDSTLHLPVVKGSTSLSIGSASLFMLNSHNEWVKM